MDRSRSASDGSSDASHCVPHAIDDAERAGAGTIAALGARIRDRAERLASPVWSPAVERRLGQLRALVDDGVALVARQWAIASRPVRTLMLACAAMCGFVGLCLGVLASRWTAAFVTAIVGSVLVILCAAAAMQQFLGDPTALPGSRPGWTLAWAVLAMAGTAVQVHARPAERRTARVVRG
ncbi:MAG: hypothetical protein U0575_01295 [Phycisphaerales bacterium]